MTVTLRLLKPENIQVHLELWRTILGINVILVNIFHSGFRLDFILVAIDGGCGIAFSNKCKISLQSIVRFLVSNLIIPTNGGNLSDYSILFLQYHISPSAISSYRCYTSLNRKSYIGKRKECLEWHLQIQVIRSSVEQKLIDYELVEENS